MKRRYPRPVPRPAAEEARDMVVEALLGLERLFVPEAKLTFVMRLPGHTETEMVITSDDPREVIAVIERRASAEESLPDRIVDSVAP